MLGTMGTICRSILVRVQLETALFLIKIVKFVTLSVFYMSKDLILDDSRNNVINFDLLCYF